MRIFLEYLKVGLWMLPIILPALWLLPRLSKRYAAKVSYVIWLLLAVRLLIPWNLTLPQETAPIHVAISEEQAASSDEILATSESMLTQAKGIAENSENVAKESRSLTESSIQLADQVKLFRI